ncbi:MAG: hypothetical protein K9L22_03955 [Methylococcaceae bacterium]|nr:hypothetical protein [Methylococcaceae bacterium]
MNFNYRLTSVVSLAHWGNDTLIYHHGSAATHIINNVPLEVSAVIFSGHIFSDRDFFASIDKGLPELAQQEQENYLNLLKKQLLVMELIEII